MSKESKSAGLQTRTDVMGQEFVDKAMQNTTRLTEPLQDWINEHVWGSVWQRDNITRQTRSLITIAMLVALKAPQELKGHIRGALNNGCTFDEIREVLLHASVYCGAPATQEAFRAAKEVLEESCDR